MSLQNIIDLFQTLGIVVLILWIALIRSELKDAESGIRDGIRNAFEFHPWIYSDRDTGRLFLAGSLSSTRLCGSTTLQTTDDGTAYWLDELPVRKVSISNFRIQRKEANHEDSR